MRLIAATTLAVGGLWGGQGVGMAACHGVALVEGPPEIATAVESLLHAHGVGSDPASCPEFTIRARLTKIVGSSTYRLHTDDFSGHRNDRQVSDAETAASLIESWTLQEDAAVLAPRGPPLIPTSHIVAAAVAPSTPGSPWSFTVAAEVLAATDSSVWFGGSVTGCLRLGETCIGGRARIAHDSDVFDHSSTGDELSRTAVEALAIVALPLSLQRLAITPVIGLGAGWMRTTVLPSPDVDAISSSDLGLRVEAAVSAGWPVIRHLALVGELGASFARPSSSSPDVPTIAGAVVVSPPTAHFQIGLGCQYVP